MIKIEKAWYNLGIQEVLQTLSSSWEGLTSDEARKRLEQYGPNELASKKGPSAWSIFLSQFKNFLIIILLVAVALSAIVREVADSIIIFVIVLFAAVLGFLQEYRAEKSLEALKKMASPLATVMRDGEVLKIPSSEVVPGDILVLSTGDRISADARIIESFNLRVDEAPLTGESVAVDKTTEPITGDVPLGDRRNMVYMGTAVVYGRGKALVVATGMATEFGKIATLLGSVEEEKTPLQVNLDRLGKWIGIGALGLCFVLATLGVLRGFEVLDMVIWGVSLAVAAVPEALPAVVTISLAIGVQRMAKRHALIRRLAAVETLGSTDFICTDKTGTLTQNAMSVRQIYVDGNFINVTGSGYDPTGEFRADDSPYDPRQSEALLKLLVAGSLCNDARLAMDNGRWVINGDPTEGALIVAAVKAGLSNDKLLDQPRVDEIPFTSERKMMTTIHRTSDGQVAYAKGAPEIVLEKCSVILSSGREQELGGERKGELLAKTQDMAGSGLRVLALAYKPLSDNAEVESGMIFLGFVGMIDPPRPEAKEALRLCESAGIKTVMITGDHKLTAVTIAKELGILKEGLALSGDEVDKLSDEEFEKIVEKIEVFARVSPSHKLRAVEALIKKGHVVAMTGDGVNDAPALKKADIGVAMGITGTDVTKEAAAMVLTDDNFASIVAAVEEGRIIFDNIKKYLMYLLSSNLGEILVMAVAMLFGSFLGTGGALPLVAIQILWVNLVTDGLPALALSVDPPAPDIMKKPPRSRNENVFTVPVTSLIILGGTWSMVVNLGIFIWAIGDGKGLVEAQCLVFMTLILIQLFKAFNFRSDHLHVFEVGLFSNRWLVLSVAISFLISLPLLYVPFLQGVFNTYPLSGQDWLIVVLSSLTIFPVLEIGKAIIRRSHGRAATLR